MARCSRCNGFMFLSSETGYCKKCNAKVLRAMMDNQARSRNAQQRIAPDQRRVVPLQKNETASETRMDTVTAIRWTADANKMFMNGQMEEGFKTVKYPAQAGYNRAQLSLGECYLKGRGTEKNIPLAFEWIRKAAEQDCPEAQLLLGQMYDVVNGYADDAAESHRWYQKAAEHGDTKAMAAVGDNYLTGRGVEKNMYKAFEWLSRVAETGDETMQYTIEAQYNIALMFYRGEGVSQDQKKAENWMLRAAHNGDPDAAIACQRMGWLAN